MKKNSLVVTSTLIVFTLVMLSCKNDEDVAVLPFESYRYELWKGLINANYEFNFIGTKTDSYYYEDYLGNHFDREHEGVGGIRTDGVLASLNSVLTTVEKPDVVLLGIGINDLLKGYVPQDIVSNIANIIQVLQSSNPEVVIFIEKIAPLHSELMTIDLWQRIERLNTLIDVLLRVTEVNRHVVSVDMNTNFSDSYLDDRIHYNIEGSQFVANKYLEAFQFYLNTDNSYKILSLGDSRVVGLRY